VRPATACALLGLAGLLAATEVAQANGAIYTCVNARGQRLTSDRPIPECLDREQQIRNRDGSSRGVLGPSMTAEERSAHEEKLRREMAAEAARRDAVRNDRNLVNRYPDEERHRQARASALEPLMGALASTERRLAELEAERRKLLEEAEFYRGKDLPGDLRQKFGRNQASIQAQRDAAQNHQAELRRINATYDQELARLRRLWAGAAPGSLSLPASSSAAR
jgi:hypothetical protein